jgi:hypothetical protein
MPTDNRRFYQRCTNCYYRAFEFLFNPNGKKITAADIVYANEGFVFPQCQHCGKEVLTQDLGHDNLIAKAPTGYTKYKGATPIHWTWYINGNNWQYKELVDASLLPFKGLKGKILDIGSGDALIPSLFMKQGFEVVGIEPEQDGIAAGKKMVPDFKNVLNTTIEEYVKGEMIPVDYIYSLNTIEHVKDPTAFVKVMDSVKEFALIVTDNAISKDGSRRRTKELHEHEFSYEELAELFSDFKTEKVEVDNGSFIAIKVYPKNYEATH